MRRFLSLFFFALAAPWLKDPVFSKGIPSSENKISWKGLIPHTNSMGISTPKYSKSSGKIPKIRPLRSPAS